MSFPQCKIQSIHGIGKNAKEMDSSETEVQRGQHQTQYLHVQHSGYSGGMMGTQKGLGITAPLFGQKILI